MSNNKLLALAKAEGFCCLWALFRANEKTSTTPLWRRLEEGCTKRAIQQQRKRYLAGEYKCAESEACLKRKITRKIS